MPLKVLSAPTRAGIGDSRKTQTNNKALQAHQKPLQGFRKAALTHPKHQLSRHAKPPSCTISFDEAEMLANNAILDKPLENKKDIFARIESPCDILRSNLAAAKLLEQINQGATEEEQRRNQLKALFLWDKVGQAVVNETLKTWQDKLNCAKEIIRCLPEELASLAKPKPSKSHTLLSKQDAYLLAESILLNKPLDNAPAILRQVVSARDLVKVDIAATKILAKMNENKSPDEIRQNNLRYLFLMHKIGVQVTETMLTTCEDYKMYAGHIFKTLIGK